jgi:hypothetical protein
MTATVKSKTAIVSVEVLLDRQGDLLNRLLKESLPEVPEAAMSEVVGAAAGDQAQAPGRAHLPRPGFVPAPGPSAVRRDR